MIARDARARPGITLTEILISILIMGVGLISLATLFPLGLIRLREASRNSRTGLAFEVAADDMDTRVLMYKPSFTQTWYWTVVNKQIVPRDPFVQDALSDNSVGNGTVIASGSNLFPANNVSLATGLPFCYDPLWRSITHVMPSVGMADPTLDYSKTYVNNVTPDEARFGAGLFSNGQYPYLRADPTDTTNTAPSAYGLQRLTNFIPWSGKVGSLNNQYPFTFLNSNLAAGNQPADVAGNVFTSNDDIVFNSFSGNPGAPSPLIPDMTQGVPQADYRFTWFITGRQLDAGGNGSQFSGEVVVCDGRPFGWDPLPGQAFNAPAGETVVEAIYAYSTPPNITNLPSPVTGKLTGTGFATGSDRTILLRWPASLGDPQVRVGGWICDTTYERDPVTYTRRTITGQTAFARCYWYQVAKRSEPQTDTLVPGSGYRSMVVTTTSPMRARSLLGTTTGQPVHVNVALVMPSVVNVFPRAFETIPIYTP